jgi:DnaJ-class molecular chaperone
MEFECRNFRPYTQALRTLTLGCVNCGATPFHHANYCQPCNGTGRVKDEKGNFDDGVNCATCMGTGRADGTRWSE